MDVVECGVDCVSVSLLRLAPVLYLSDSRLPLVCRQPIFHDLTLAECFWCGRTVEVSEIGAERAAAGWSALASGPTDGALPVAGNNECRRLAAQSRWKRYFSHPSHFYGERRTVTLGGERVYVRNNRLTV